MSCSFESIKQKANLVRSIDLVAVLEAAQAVKDKSDKASEAPPQTDKNRWQFVAAELRCRMLDPGCRIAGKMTLLDLSTMTRCLIIRYPASGIQHRLSKNLTHLLSFSRIKTTRWHTPKGPISIRGQKFMNWSTGTGGGGAIDLVMHLKNFDFKTAVFWLAATFPAYDSQKTSLLKRSSKPILRLPGKDDTRISQVIHYLVNTRSISASIIKPLIHSGNLYADSRGNAVFLLLGKEKRVVGAELRGTTHIRWHGMAPGSRKDLGYFSVENPIYSRSLGRVAKKMLVCESAIDAISFFDLCPTFLAVSTAGANPNPPWLASFINSGCEIYCGFDSDEAGDRLAQKMIALHPTIKRLRPSKHDWNDVLISHVKR